MLTWTGNANILVFLPVSIATQKCDHSAHPNATLSQDELFRPVFPIHFYEAPGSRLWNLEYPKS